MQFQQRFSLLVCLFAYFWSLLKCALAFSSYEASLCQRLCQWLLSSLEIKVQMGPPIHSFNYLWSGSLLTFLYSYFGLVTNLLLRGGWVGKNHILNITSLLSAVSGVHGKPKNLSPADTRGGLYVSVVQCNCRLFCLYLSSKGV